MFKHGAAVVGIEASHTAALAREGLSNYAGGVYMGCRYPSMIDHAVLGVGWGHENGLDYWLIKNLVLQEDTFRTCLLP